MLDLSSNTLCRICLQDGATYPIFEELDTDVNVYKKLLLCLQSEKIEDVDGFPRYLCSECNNTLATLYDFVNKYRESNKILENGVKIVKKEINYDDATESKATSSLEVNVKGIKLESNDHFDVFGDDDEEKPLYIAEKIKRRPVKRQSTIQKNKTYPGSGTNKIASSILEGRFSWIGENWCMNIEQTTIKRISSKPRPQTKVKVPNLIRKPEKKLCDLCGDTFNDQDRLSIHKRKVHFKNPVKCPKCPRVCVSNYYLKRHLKRKHETTKDFICSTCGHGFAFKGELTTHFKNVHNKHLKPKKTYTCQFCQKSYKCHKSVVVHERSVHTGQRPAECSVCGSSFYHDDYLKEHMRLHTGETPFKCPICGRGYAQRGNMKSHLRIHKMSELDPVTMSKMRPNYLKLLKV